MTLGKSNKKSAYSLVSATAAFILIVSIVAVTGQAYAQMMPKQVSGKYVNSDWGLEIEFPSGWTGIESSFEEGITSVSLNKGFSGDSFSMTSISLTMVDLSKAEESSQEETTSPPGEAPTDVPDFKCDTETISSADITINGVRATETVIHTECTGAGMDMSTKFKSVSIELDENRSIELTYMANPASDYNKNIAEFDKSIQTLKIEGVASTNVGLQLKTIVHSVLVADKSIELQIQSSSTISDFKLDEQRKQVLFKASGQDGTQGTTIIPVSKVLKGPYTVTVDGQVVTDFETMENKATGETSIKLTYHHSTRDVTIAGTQVVPEFGTIAALIMAVSILAAVIAFRAIGKKRLNGADIGMTSSFGR